MITKSMLVSLKKLFVLPLFCFSIVMVGQDASSSIKDKISYSFKDGYKIGVLNEMFFDKHGMLWLAGGSSNINEFQLAKDNYIIQRYDGLAFHDFILPIQEHQKGYLDMIKRKDGMLNVLFRNKNQSILYLVDPATLISTEIALFQRIEPGYKNIQMFPYKNGVLVITIREQTTDFYYIQDDNKLILLNTMDNLGEYTLHFSHLVEYEDHFLINEQWHGLFRFSDDGQLLKANEVLVSERLIKEEKLNLGNYFRKGDKTFFYFNNIDGFYKYDEREKNFQLSNLKLSDVKQHIAYLYEDPNENIAIVTNGKERHNVKCFLNSSSDYINRNEFHLEYLSKVVSRDLRKELIVVSDNRLEHYFFSNPQIETHLHDYSIRSIFQKSQDAFIVATANSGWFELDTRTGQTKKMEFEGPTPIAPLNENRAIFKTKNGYFSNNPNGIVYLDTLTKKTTSYVYYPVLEMVEDSRYIYYGTTKHKLMKFDKVERKNIPLADTDTLTIIGLKRHKGVLYGATEYGILVYKDSRASLHKASISDALENDFISVYADDYFGVLVGSRSGKVYRFDTENYTFEILYSDKLDASVATMLVDKQNKLWLNTFAGIVSFDPTTKTEIRYSGKDGMSHYECNRYSALRTDDGRFFVGTVKGLNIFRPDELNETALVGQPTITSVSYFDKSRSQWIKETSPAFTNSLKTITLPASQRRVTIDVGMNGIVNNYDMRYKYQLSKNGIEGEWNELTNKNQISLTNLDRGKYVLLVKAYSPIQGDIGEALGLNIIAQSFFYETWWFTAILFLFFAGLIMYYLNQLKTKEKFQTQLTQNLIKGQEVERARLSRELHDGVGQQLILLIRKSRAENQSEITTLAGEVLEDVRNITKNLHPSILDRLGITETLRQMTHSLDESTSLFFTVDIDEIDNLLSKVEELNLYRFVQESLNNIIKHAEAKSVLLEIEKRDTYLHMTIKDNGKGFDLKEQLSTSYSLGLQTLYERIKMMSGKLTIKSEVDKGTKITATIPYVK